MRGEKSARATLAKNLTVDKAGMDTELPNKPKADRRAYLGCDRKNRNWRG